MAMVFKSKRTSGYGSKKLKRSPDIEAMELCTKQFFDRVDSMFAPRRAEKPLDVQASKSKEARYGRG